MGSGKQKQPLSGRTGAQLDSGKKSRCATDRGRESLRSIEADNSAAAEGGAEQDRVLSFCTVAQCRTCGSLRSRVVSTNPEMRMRWRMCLRCGQRFKQIGEWIVEKREC